MHTRQLGIAALALAGAAIGVVLHRALPAGALALPWSAGLLLAGGLAIAVPVALGSLGSNGNFRAMVRLWTACGALGVLLLGAGVAPVLLALALGDAGRPPGWLIATGVGLLAGAGLVKLSLRRAAAS